MKSADTLLSIKENQLYVSIFHLPGEPISQHRLRYTPIAVLDNLQSKSKTKLYIKFNNIYDNHENRQAG